MTCSKYLQFECPCLFDDKRHEKKTAAQMRAVLTLYLRGTEKLLASGRYDGRKDFTVVLQPFTIKPNLPTSSPRPGARPQLDISYLAPDCFHFGQKIHAAGRWELTFYQGSSPKDKIFNCSCSCTVEQVRDYSFSWLNARIVERNATIMSASLMKSL